MMEMRVKARRSWVMRKPFNSSAQETELLFGHSFRVEKQEKSWVFGQALSPLGQDVEGYKGWMKRKSLTENQIAPSHYIPGLKAPVFKTPDIKSRVLRLLPLGAQVNAAQADDTFYHIKGEGYIHRRHILPLGTYAQTDFVAIAEAHIGLPYIWGGMSSDGLDCSGLVQSSLRAIGRDCLRDAGPQEESLGRVLKAAEPLRRGDLVFWAGHVGIMRSAETLLHANAFHMAVACEPLKLAIARIGPPRCLRRL